MTIHVSISNYFCLQDVGSWTTNYKTVAEACNFRNILSPKVSLYFVLAVSNTGVYVAPQKKGVWKKSEAAFLASGLEKRKGEHN